MQLCTGWRVDNAAATTAISPQRRRSVGVLGQEFGTHYATSPWTSKAKSTGANTVSFVCAGPPLPSWKCTTVPCRDTSTHIWCRLTTTSSFWLHIHASRSTNTLSHTEGWQSVSSGRCEGMECITGNDQISIVVSNISTVISRRFC